MPTFHKQLEERLGKTEGAARVGENVAMVVGDILFARGLDALRSTDFEAERRDVALSHFSLHYRHWRGEIFDIYSAPAISRA